MCGWKNVVRQKFVAYFGFLVYELTNQPVLSSSPVSVCSLLVLSKTLAEREVVRSFVITLNGKTGNGKRENWETG